MNKLKINPYLADLMPYIKNNSVMLGWHYDTAVSIAAEQKISRRFDLVKKYALAIPNEPAIEAIKIILPLSSWDQAQDII